MPGSQQHSLFQMLDILIYIFYQKKRGKKTVCPGTFWSSCWLHASQRR